MNLYDELLDLVAHAQGPLTMRFGEKRISEALDVLEKLEKQRYVDVYPQISGALMVVRSRDWEQARHERRQSISGA